MMLRVAQFFLKIAHLSFSMGPRGDRAYGLRPRLWLLIIFERVQLCRTLSFRKAGKGAGKVPTGAYCNVL